MTRLLALTLALAPAAASAHETAGPSLSGAYALDPTGDATDVALAIGLEGRVSGAPAIGAGIEAGWALQSEAAFLGMRYGIGYWLVTLDGVVQGVLGAPGAGLSVAPELSLAIPFRFVGDASLAAIFAKYDHYLLGLDDFSDQVVGGLRFVIDTTR